MRITGSEGFSRTPGIRRQIQNWAYTDSKRDLRLDFIRGLAVIVMVIDHVGGDNSWLYALTGDNHFFISAAEPFVFISGLVMGLVYSAVIARRGLWAGMKKALKRSAWLYCLNVVLGLVLAVVSLQLALPWAPHWGKEGLVGFALGLATLHRTYYLTDVLLLYTLLVAVSAPLFALLSKRRAWATMLVLGGSWGLWLAWQFWPQRVDLPWPISGNGIFHFSSWQVLFITGVVIGFHHKVVVTWLRTARRAALYAILGASGALAAASVCLYVWSQNSAGSVNVLLARLFEKADMRVGRIVVFAAFVMFTFLALTFAWKPINRLIGWLVLPLGQNALNAYVLHILFAVTATAAVPAILGGAADHPSSNTAAQLIGVLLIWSFIRLARPLLALGGRLRILLSGEIQRPSRAGKRMTVPALGIGAVACVVIVLGLMISTVALRGPVSRTIRSLNEKGKNTVVMVPTVTVIMPSAATASGGQQNTAPEQVLSQPQSQATSTPEPQITALDLVGTPLALSLAPQQWESPAATPAPHATPTQTPLPVGAQWMQFYSKSLGRTMPYIVYLPPDYTASTATRFPVLYMLHGVGADDATLNTEWIRYGLLGWADELMRAKLIKQFIIVLPQGGQSYWVDQANGGPQWGAYVARDFVAEIDSHYRTLAQRDKRAIAGISMGGHAALQLPINYPDVFGIAAADSPSLHTYDSAPSFFGDETYFEAHDPSYLFEAHPELARTLKLWIDIGQQDAWLPIVSAFHRQLVSEDIPHEWHVYSGDILTGGHTGEYWSTHIPDYLRFFSSAFGS